MFKVKRLNIFMLKTFMPMFLMTFFICLFILILFFCYRYITDMVGKGLSIGVLGELFMHVGITFIPTALPLAILLASLMTFGNLGEHLELTALKSSGISLINAMKPLMAFIILVAIGAFFFQNYIIPQSQVKMWTLLFSARQKSLTLDITEGTINSQIPGYNVYVKHKDKETETLHNLLIYDVTPQGGYPRIVTADSGRLSMTDDMKHLVLHLHHGEWYEELNSGGGNNSQLGGESYRRESYTEKKILIPYDATFTRMDDNTMKSQYVGKNIAQLQHTIDSVQLRVDSVGDILSREMRTQVLCGVPVNRIEYHNNHQVYVPVEPVKMAAPIDVDSLFDSMTPQARQLMTSQALMIATSNKQNVEFKSFVVKDDNFTIRRHMIELQRKFTLSLACLIFFFIGAPLGAIIRKGGLGMPIVISVLLFIVYYIIDNTGYKLAREGRWQVWQGIWLSSAILLPFGIFLTHKAVNDSAVFNIESYSSIIK
ncbi:MAG: LptF/LptG family permease, partial [Muribaculaceae bacterium]|nr:LptF/LptG family permease [Muribaculaceae bacterium]